MNVVATQRHSLNPGTPDGIPVDSDDVTATCRPTVPQKKI